MSALSAWIATWVAEVSLCVQAMQSHPPKLSPWHTGTNTGSSRQHASGWRSPSDRSARGECASVSGMKSSEGISCLKGGCGRTVPVRPARNRSRPVVGLHGCPHASRPRDRSPSRPATMPAREQQPGEMEWRESCREGWTIRAVSPTLIGVSGRASSRETESAPRPANVSRGFV